VDYIDLVRKFLKLVRERDAQLTETLKSGSIQDHEQYQRIIGELSGLSFAEFTIKDLLENEISLWEDEDE
jgi:hypothetical protein|tara:strand:+ start:655 stop:864 length:210 start_codon:yes stop_codon:yes gene_type:complete